ncbi:MAG: glycoside hydrolase family 3 C-terminal domain-containing protein [Clostridiales bacterium]|nr:glycoside hydrolase family 3 C-terminal domain-containing protein [Clostridiales bacterium]
MEAERLDIEKALAYLTREEKLRMLSGDGMWHTFGTGQLPRVRMSDGPSGLRMTNSAGLAVAIPATCFPTPSMLANSWDAALCYSVGAAIGREATAMGVNVLLAPALNIKRNPLGGRNFEYLSEDPLLAGELGKAYVAGVQSTGVGACIKHFAANSQENLRMYSDSVVDPRALRELYLKPFEMALQAKPAAIMCAYNKLNGTYCSESEFLLKQLLRDEWKYEGVALSDWGAVHDRAKALKAGLDLAMPCTNDEHYNSLNRALDDGEITQDDIDASLSRILRMVDDTYLEPYGDFDADMHERIAYNAAAASLVLLKNEDGFLPLTKNMKVAVVGSYYKDAPIQGGGSSHVTAIKNITPKAAFSERAISVKYIDDLSAAVEKTADFDAVIVYVGQPAPSEGVDRETLSLPAEQDKLITDLTAAGRKVVVVLCSAGPVLMPWVNRVQAILYAGLNGSCGALAAVDALYGRINPSGHLSETFPISQEDFGQDFGGLRAVYRESFFVGYRYYDALEKRVLFPFGHGLSFCDVQYDNMHVKRYESGEFDVTVTLTNLSARDAYETVQIYVSDRTGRIMCAKKQLAGYAKVFVEGQTTTTATIRLNRSAFEFFNTKTGAFDVCDGEYKIIAASSATDIKKEMTVKVNGSFFEYAYQPYIKNLAEITDKEFKRLYGAPLPAAAKRPERGEFTLDCCVDDIKHTFIGKCIKHSVKRRSKSAGPAGSVDRKAFINFAMFTPLYAVCAMSDGDLPLSTAKGIVEMANGSFIKGLKTMLKRNGSERK